MLFSMFFLPNSFGQYDKEPNVKCHMQEVEKECQEFHDCIVFVVQLTHTWSTDLYFACKDKGNMSENRVQVTRKCTFF